MCLWICVICDCDCDCVVNYFDTFWIVCLLTSVGLGFESC